ncbi:hypothetical protein GTH32_04850 [Alteromonas sp. 345S023]|uniref:Uncharacterized protein n=2 Tax=Alteromonas profundi TaxID=2696062 RepID=A0A7X5RKA4_9ALTE|nr:hypothetical protein [Alteromonas profundi]
MLRLSKRAMNNVVIITMLVMIGLFNLDSFLPPPKPAKQRPLLPENAYVLKIEQDDHKLERVGQSWRQVSSVASMGISANQQYTAWQQAQLTAAPFVENTSAVSPIVVVVWLAGQPQGQVYAFYPQTQPPLVQIEDDWYQLENVQLHALLPWLAHP